MNLELHPLGQSGRSGQARQTHRLGGIARAARVRQNEKPFRIDEIENVRERITPARNIGAAEGNGTYKLDFKVGGRESSRGDLPDGQTYTYDATFQDIVPDERIIYSYDMVFGGKRISVSVSTVELKPAGKGTKLTFTEQGAFLDGLDNPAQREAGTKQILDKLGTTLKV